MTDDTDDFLFAQHVGLNSPDFIFAFWGSVAWVRLISFYFSGVQPHLGAPQGDLQFIRILLREDLPLVFVSNLIACEGIQFATDHFNDPFLV